MAGENKPNWFWPIVGWLVKHWSWVSILVGGLIASAVAPFTEYLRRFAPFSYVLAFFLGALLTAIIALIVTFAIRMYAKSKYWKHVTANVPQGINPMQRLFTEMRINPPAVSIPESHIVRDKDFHRCEILGQRLTYVFHNSNFVTLPQFIGCNYISTPAPFETGPNIFVFDKCNFTECKFYFMTLLFSESQARDLIRGGLKTGWIVSPSPDKAT